MKWLLWLVTGFICGVVFMASLNGVDIRSLIDGFVPDVQQTIQHVIDKVKPHPKPTMEWRFSL